ncbi:hypothetical protein [Planococcus sp. CAU13]|uniref:hypothetical protein n=1 Tax=Planococcus sp. CAU13 TaxID=1541197 RepID=UPI00052FEDEC|nr:hypothetical protein [Planococcus sp. CAU13]
MEHLYVLEIPDLQSVLNQEDIVIWELFLLNEEKRYEKMRFQLSGSEGCYTFDRVEACNSRLGKVQIDFDNKRLIFEPGAAEDKEFEQFLLHALSQIFVRIKNDRIQFLATANNKRKKRLNTRR